MSWNWTASWFGTIAPGNRISSGVIFGTPNAANTGGDNVGPLFNLATPIAAYDAEGLETGFVQCALITTDQTVIINDDLTCAYAITVTYPAGSGNEVTDYQLQGGWF